MRDLFIDSKRIDLASYIANNGTAAGTAAPAPASPAQEWILLLTQQCCWAVAALWHHSWS